jgi:GrpB-like predicted nucleotidyltransferase (UPF0157 family)
MTNEELWEIFPIVLKEYDPEWIEWYLAEEQRIKVLFGENSIFRISHIGSTAVEGLLAKPTVDILLEIPKDTDPDQVRLILEKDGYIYSEQRENPPPHMLFMKGYTPEGFAKRVYHVHLRYPGDWKELYFRDYLREHKDVADQYAELKKTLKEKFEHDRDGYTDAKSDFITNTSEKAIEEYGRRYATDRMT